MGMWVKFGEVATAAGASCGSGGAVRQLRGNQVGGLGGREWGSKRVI